MRKIVGLIIGVTFVITSCKKFNINNKDIIEPSLEKKVSKDFGSVEVRDYKFPKSWKIDIYGNDNTLKKEDLKAQSMLEKIDYFDKLKPSLKDEKIKIKLNNFIKSDSILKQSKIDSLFVVDITKLSKTTLLFVKSIGSFGNVNYDQPVTFRKIDIIIYDENSNNLKNIINAYSEIDLPSLTKQNICYLDENGNLYCRKFFIEENNVKSTDIKKTNIINKNHIQ